MTFENPYLWLQHNDAAFQAILLSHQYVAKILQYCTVALFQNQWLLRRVSFFSENVTDNIVYLPQVMWYLCVSVSGLTLWLWSVTCHLFWYIVTCKSTLDNTKSHDSRGEVMDCTRLEQKLANFHLQSQSKWTWLTGARSLCHSNVTSICIPHRSRPVSFPSAKCFRKR